LKPTDQGDTTTIDQTLAETVEQLIAVEQATGEPIAIVNDLVADKGYHSRDKVRELNDVGFRTYISEPDRPPQGWIDQHAERDAVYANRRRIRGARGQRLLRKRGELLERPSAHLYETGGMRRTHLRGHDNILKRLLLHASACNLGLWMRTACGVGTPRGLQGRAVALGAMITVLCAFIDDVKTTIWPPHGDHTPPDRPLLGLLVAGSVP
jgi:transposase